MTKPNAHYSGGFKNVDNSKISGCINNSLYRPDSNPINDSEVKQVGVSKFKQQSKYRDEQPQSKYRDENGVGNSSNAYTANTL